MKRRYVWTALAALPGLGPIATLAAGKVTTCHACSGNGNCAAGNICQDYKGEKLCMPIGDVCGGKKRHFECRKHEPACCRPKHGCARV